MAADPAVKTVTDCRQSSKLINLLSFVYAMKSSPTQFLSLYFPPSSALSPPFQVGFLRNLGLRQITSPATLQSQMILHQWPIVSCAAERSEERRVGKEGRSELSRV